MLYNYFQPFNIVCSIFGIRKPSFSSKGEIINSSIVHKIWSLIVILALIASYYLTSQVRRLDFKVNLLQISILNDLITNAIILVLHILTGEDIAKYLYDYIISILNDLGLNDRRVRILVQKFYLWFSFLSGIFIAGIILELIYDSPPYVLILRVSTFLTISHLIFHLNLFVAILKILNYKLSNETLIKTLAFSGLEIARKSVFKYFLNPEISFVEELQATKHKRMDLKQLCKIYDKMATCLELLIKLHGLQVFFVIWLTFSNAVVGVTILSCNQVKAPWLASIKTFSPYLWCFTGAYVDDQIRKQVDSTEIILIKTLIDFRCDQTRKNTVETFKQLVRVSRLQFTACGLFHISYSMLLAMAMNVITYSIILIQIFSS